MHKWREGQLFLGNNPILYKIGLFSKKKLYITFKIPVKSSSDG